MSSYNGPHEPGEPVSDHIQPEQKSGSVFYLNQDINNFSLDGISVHNVESAFPLPVNRLTYDEGDVYVGEIFQEYRHGLGKYTWAADGSIYFGYWVFGKRIGKGIFIWKSGEYYAGEWLDARMHGFGKYAFSTGDIYEGNWVNDLKHGFGTYRYASGSIYEGEWNTDKRSGKGKYI